MKARKERARKTSLERRTEEFVDLGRRNDDRQRAINEMIRVEHEKLSAQEGRRVVLCAEILAVQVLEEQIALFVVETEDRELHV